MIERIKLTEDQIEERLGNGWLVLEGKLSREFHFDSYGRGVLFAVAVSHLAEKMDHHPDLVIGYQKVTVAVNTHDVGGISPVDFELARRVDAL